MTDRVFRTLSARPEGGLDHDCLPMRLWHKAKQIGVWDPRGIDFTTDRGMDAALEETAAELAGPEGEGAAG